MGFLDLPGGRYEPKFVGQPAPLRKGAVTSQVAVQSEAGDEAALAVSSPEGEARDRS